MIVGISATLRANGRLRKAAQGFRLRNNLICGGAHSLSMSHGPDVATLEAFDAEAVMLKFRRGRNGTQSDDRRRAGGFVFEQA
ncbi:hypothetical protein [Rhodopila globiformis]|uniref:hypothetical protein n=1 Tax=Rhodopila globiformis TaxID=1071 RepID=UPI001304F226|nr:hypothetical protein [Rhodopila globiformis]